MRGAPTTAIAIGLILACAACGEMRSTFSCGPAAYTAGPDDGKHQPVVANTCPSKENAEWFEPAP